MYFIRLNKKKKKKKKKKQNNKYKIQFKKPYRRKNVRA